MLATLGAVAPTPAEDALDELLGEAPAPREPSETEEAAAPPPDEAPPPARDTAADRAGEPAAEAAPAVAPAGRDLAAPKQVVEEIVVTAQKREGALQDTPMSMTALGGDDLGFRAVRDVDDLQYQVPNLNVGNREGNTVATIRGVGLSVEFGSVESGVAMHVDGQYQPRVTTGILGMNDLERVEVLRGPQGTLYGRNATGGAINFILRKPTDEPEGELRIGGGSFGQLDTVGIVSGPIVEGLLNGRAMAEYTRNDGFIENVTLDETVGGRTGYGGRVAFQLFPLDDLTVDLSAILRIDEGGPVVVMVNPPEPDLEAMLTIVPPTSPDEYVLGDIYKVKENNRERGHKDTSNVTTTMTWDAGLATVRSITGFQYHYIDYHYDNDATARPTFYLNPRKDRSISVQQEMNLSSTLDAWWGTRLDWLVGGFFFNEDYRILVNIPIETSVIPGLRVFASGDENIRAWAGFADGTLALTDWLRVFGGLRLSFEEKNSLQNLRAFTAAGQVPPTENLPPELEALLPTATCDDDRLSTSFDDLTPRYGVQIDALDNVMIYAQRALGFKSGGANITACDNLYDPEEVDSEEVGIKTTWLDGIVTANFSLFRNDYTNFQVLKTTALEGPVVNADSASVEGAELEIFALPWEGVTFNLAASWLDAVYEEFFDTDPTNPNAGEQDLAGNALNRAPDYTVTLGLEYAWPIPVERLGTLRLRGEWFRTDDVWYRPYGEPDDKQDPYSLVNAFASVTNASENVELRLIGKNLEGTEYLINIAGQQLGTKYAQPGLPRFIGSELILRF